jgi:hypothetical protein
MLKDEVLDLRPKQVRLMPSSFQNRPFVLYPIFRKIVVKLNSYFVSAQWELYSVVFDWMIVILGSYYDLYRCVIDTCRIKRDVEEVVGVGSSARPGVWGDEGRSAWCSN